MTFSFSLGVRFSDTFKGKFGNAENIEIQAESVIDDVAKDSEEKIEEIKEELEEEQEQNIEQNIENKVENTEKTMTNDFEEPISMDGVEEGIYQEENIKTIENDMIDNTDITETNTQNIENQSQNFNDSNNQVQETNQ